MYAVKQFTTINTLVKGDSGARILGPHPHTLGNTEKYISFSLGNLRCIDSVNFLQSSLDSLVKGSDPQSQITEKRYQDEEKRTLLLDKGIYPYEYMDCFERFGEAKLPAKELLHPKLNGKSITEEEYAHAQKVWEVFGFRGSYVSTSGLFAFAWRLFTTEMPPLIPLSMQRCMS